MEKKIGEVVAKELPETVKQQFNELTYMKMAGQEMMTDSLKQVLELWKTLSDEYGLDVKKYDYGYRHKTNDIIVKRRRYNYLEDDD